ncbi:MAG: AAA family ATPase [Deltaproteobacteria bacterium]
MTESLLAERFEIRREGDVRVLVKRLPESAALRTLLGKPTPCVGREKELALLEATLRESLDEGGSRALLVTAPPGTGKSRLRRELMSRLGRGQEHRVLFARAESIEAGASLVLLERLVRDAAGLGPEEHDHEKLRRHVESLPGLVSSGRVAEFLGELVGAPTTSAPGPALRAARSDGQLMADWLRRIAVEWLGALAGRGSTVIVLEDAHWGDAPTFTCLAEALRVHSKLPLSVLIFARPELDALLPPGLRSAQEIALEPLRPRAAERLVRAVLGDAIAPHTRQAAIAVFLGTVGLCIAGMVDEASGLLARRAPRPGDEPVFVEWHVMSAADVGAHRDDPIALVFAQLDQVDAIAAECGDALGRAMSAQFRGLLLCPGSRSEAPARLQIELGRAASMPQMIGFGELTLAASMSDEDASIARLQTLLGGDLDSSVRGSAGIFLGWKLLVAQRIVEASDVAHAIEALPLFQAMTGAAWLHACVALAGSDFENALARVCSRHRRARSRDRAVRGRLRPAVTGRALRGDRSRRASREALAVAPEQVVHDQHRDGAAGGDEHALDVEPSHACPGDELEHEPTENRPQGSKHEVQNQAPTAPGAVAHPAREEARHQPQNDPADDRHDAPHFETT